MSAPRLPSPFKAVGATTGTRTRSGVAREHLDGSERGERSHSQQRRSTSGLPAHVRFLLREPVIGPLQAPGRRRKPFGTRGPALGPAVAAREACLRASHQVHVPGVEGRLVLQAVEQRAEA